MNSRRATTQLEMTFTPQGALVRLIVVDGEPIGGVAIPTPHPWVFRRPYLEPSDVD